MKVWIRSPSPKEFVSSHVGGHGPQTVQTYMQIIHSISIMKGIPPLIIIIAPHNEWESFVKWMGADEKMH